MPRIHRILYASDFSKPSKRAFVRALEFARMARAELVIQGCLCGLGRAGSAPALR